ncbi:MAG TPA: hypothetical protein VII96_12830 [Acidimicrobiales bacterium]
MDTDPGPEGRAPVPDGPAEPGADAGPRQDGSPATDDAVTSDDPGDPEVHVPHEPLPFQQWIKRSTSGAVLTGIALGLQQVYQPKRELPAFVMEAPGEPEDPDAPITLHFDPDDPTKTVAVIRTPTSGATPDRTPEPDV